MTTSNNGAVLLCFRQFKPEIYFVLVFPFQVWLSFAQFETSTAVEESIEQARLVKIIRLSTFQLRSKCRVVDYM